MTRDGMESAHFFERGWVRFARDPEVAAWTARALPVAEACLGEPAHRARWMRCGGTWFAGVGVFPNDAMGGVPGGRRCDGSAYEGRADERGVPPLSGAPVTFVATALGLAGFGWDAGQLSVCYPGYPQPWDGESEAALRFRRDRDAAHLDGLARFDGRRRRLGETHGFILGLPLEAAPPDAAPLVVWEGSHEVMRRTLRARLGALPPETWAREDVTDAYAAARRIAFERCRRVTVHAHPGEAYLVHRLALHGVAPWPRGAGGAGPPQQIEAPKDVSGGGTAPRHPDVASARAQANGGPRRMILYFRPDPFPGAAPGWWLDRP